MLNVFKRLSLFALFILAGVPVLASTPTEPSPLFGSGSRYDQRLDAITQQQEETNSNETYSAEVFPDNPGNLRLFGFTGACNTPLYEVETAPFSNVCLIDLKDARLLDPKWVTSLHERGIKLIIGTHNTFFELERAPTPAEPYPPFKLRQNYEAQWRADIAGKESALGGLTAYFYLADEPNWTGISRMELGDAHDEVKRSFPLLKTMTSFNHLVTASWFNDAGNLPDVYAYHQYAIRNPRTDVLYQQKVLLIKQYFQGKEFIRVLDGWWSAGRHGAAGIAREDVAEVGVNYYAESVRDPDTVGLIGFHWPTWGEGAGARDLREARWTYQRIGSAVTRKCLAPEFVPNTTETLAPENALFFQNCRFFATVQYWIPWEEDITGMAVAVPESQEFGNFWFFGSNNIEGGLKVWDGRVVNNHWWVFASGFTSLPIEIQIYDQHDSNSLVWTYTTPGGPPAYNHSFPDCEACTQ